MQIFEIQHELAVISSGGSGSVRDIGDNVVLKAPLIYCKPLDTADPKDVRDYQYYTLDSYRSIDYEREIFQRLASNPHPNVIRVVALNFPEGIYLEKHVSLRQRLITEPSSLATRLTWYADIAHAMAHLHRSGLVHIDLRVNNVLCDCHDRAVLCDLGSVGEIGIENVFAKVGDDGIVDLNGVSSTLSDATDRFAFASMIFEIETGNAPNMKVLWGGLETPDVDTGSKELDSIVTRAWDGSFVNTADMFRALEQALRLTGASYNERRDTIDQTLAVEKVDRWRQSRIQQFGERAPSWVSSF